MRCGFFAISVVLSALFLGCSSDSTSDEPSAATGAGGGQQSAGGSPAQGAGGGTSQGAGGSSSQGAGGGPVCGEAPDAHHGDGTYYAADGSGNCSFPATPNDLLVGAMNHTDYLSSAVCGSCAKVTGAMGTITIRIVDQCPECKPGDIDLSPQAFDMIDAHEKGRVPISWGYVPCAVSGPIVYHFKDGSNPYWTAVQIRNHANAIATFEYKKNGAYVKVDRMDYNFFVDTSGMGPGPYDFRITDVAGHVLEDSGIPLLDNADASGSGQFPACN